MQPTVCSSIINVQTVFLASNSERGPRRKLPPPSAFTKRPEKGKASKTTFYVRDMICLPATWCCYSKQISVPRLEQRNPLAKSGLMEKIQLNSEMTEEDVRHEVCRVFAVPMGLHERELEEGTTFPFQYLQRTEAGSCTLCVPSVSPTFSWNGRQVSTLAKSGGIIYIMATRSLPGLQVRIHACTVIHYNTL